ncbi:MAG: DUF2147 domain-containing protein [Bacteroidales bacterium]|nr:DUF2147 domain-containing protein [Bacteroidales bacterium]
MKKFLTLFLSLCFSTGLFAQANNILGVWYNQEKSAKIEIYQMGGKFYGKIIWLKEANGADGNPKLDVKNSDEKLRTQSVIGLIMLKNLTYNPKNKKWEDGTIYDPASGKTYKSYAWFEGNQTNTLNVRGHLGISSWLGRSQTWERTTAE